MAKGTVKLHRVLKTKPERLYRAFLDAGAMAKWLPPYGFTCTVHHLDAKVGGTFKMSFTNFTTGNGHSFGGEYLELKPSEKIVYTDKFDDPNLPGAMKTTVTIKAVSAGTELNVVIAADRSFARETRTVRVFAVYDPTDGTTFARVIGAISLRDSVWVEGSGGLFIGTSDDTLGRLSTRDFVYARLRVFF